MPITIKKVLRVHRIADIAPWTRLGFDGRPLLDCRQEVNMLNSTAVICGCHGRAFQYWTDAATHLRESIPDAEYGYADVAYRVAAMFGARYRFSKDSVESFLSELNGARTYPIPDHIWNQYNGTSHP